MSCPCCKVKATVCQTQTVDLEDHKTIPCSLTSTPRCKKTGRFEGTLSKKARKLRDFTQQRFTVAIAAAQSDVEQLKKEVLYEQIRAERSSDTLHQQTEEKIKLADENKNLKQLLRNAETQLEKLCQAKEQTNCHEQKSVLEQLECSLCRTRRLTDSVQEEIKDLKMRNCMMRQNSSTICSNLELTLEDAKNTQKELEKIEKMFRSHCSTKCYTP